MTRNILRLAGSATLAACLCSSIASAAAPNDGAVYNGWGLFGGGKNFAAFDISGNLTDLAAASVVGPDGSLYVAGTVEDGNTTRIGVAKFNPDGILDLTFSDDGRNVTLESDVIATGIALTPGGHLLISGIKIVSASEHDMIVCRFHSGSGANIDFPAPVNNACVRPVWPAGTKDEAVGVVAYPDNSFVIGGTIGVNNGGYAAFARFQANGQPDLSFGNILGSNLTLIRSENIFVRHRINAITMASNGKIVAVGSTRVVNDNKDIGLMLRIRSDGTPDGLSQTPEFPFGLADVPETDIQLRSVVTVKESSHPDDATYIAGAARIGGFDQGLVVKVTPAGTAFSSSDFGIHPGFSLFSLNGSHLVFQSIAYQPGVGFLLGSSRPGTDAMDMAVQRIDRYGWTDTTFGTGGGFFVDFGYAGAIDLLASVKVQGDGIYVAGHSLVSGGDFNFTVAKHRLDRIFFDGLEDD